MNVIRLLFVFIGALATTGTAQPTEAKSSPGHAARYILADPIDEPHANVASFTLAVGTTSNWIGPTSHQGIQLAARKGNGDTYRVWLRCSTYPPEKLREAQDHVFRYIVQHNEETPREYLRVGASPLGFPFAVLPFNGAWPSLLPRPMSWSTEENKTPDYPPVMQLLGLKYRFVETVDAPEAAEPDNVHVIHLRPDVLTGVPHNTRQVDETRRWDDSEYEYIPLEQSDFRTMIDAGLNCFRATPETVPWFRDQDVFYWGVDGKDITYPEDLYDPQYLGPALFLDEPMVVTRDHRVRPRLREDPDFRTAITPQAALAEFEEHFASVMETGAPTRLQASLAKREDVNLGDMVLAPPSLASWETMVSSAVHQLLYHPETPGAIVFEPPGEMGHRRTLPEMNMTYGCQIPVAGTNHFYDIVIGFLRGAARASGKEWGISIYGGLDRTEAPAFITRAYELGATRFFYWDNHRLACVPFGEILQHTRHLNRLATDYLHRDLDALLKAAEVAILLPPGYNLGHVYLGRGLLWGVGELNLERKNSEGVPYRTVMHNFFTEIERCLRLGVAFDLMWDVPDLKLDGYREIVHVREDGKVEVRSDGEPETLDGPRIPQRPQGSAPDLRLTVWEPSQPAPAKFSAIAKVKSGSAPVYYAPEPFPTGIHYNMGIAWEVYGPDEQDYTSRPPAVDITLPLLYRGETAMQQAMINLTEPGAYRIRAATTDLAGRSTVVWKEVTVTAPH